mgnify:CR=1 FL=1
MLEWSVKMRIATMATGGIGGYIAVKLTKQGQEVAAIARGSHLEAIKNKGLQLSSKHGIETVKPWKATSDTKQIGPVDVIIFGVKCHALEEAAESGKGAASLDGKMIDAVSARMAQNLVKMNVLTVVAIAGQKKMQTKRQKE